MINQTLHPLFPERKHAPFGARLKSAREIMGMDRKEAAAQLRLQEKIITMLESGDLDPGLPLTFVRGYLRNYSKLLNIPENEVKLALEAMQPKPAAEETAPATPMHVSGPAATTDSSMPVSFGNFFMQLFTYLLAITVIGLVGIWWHTQKATDQADAPENTIVQAPGSAEIIQPPTQPPVLGPLTRAENAAGPEMQDTKSSAVQPEEITKPTPKPETAAPVKPVPQKPWQIFNRHDKPLTKDLVLGGYGIQVLSSLILLLVTLTIGYRLYGDSYKSTRQMASARLNRTPGRKQRTKAFHWPKPFLPKISLPRFSLPTFSLPKISLPSFKLPKAITAHQTMMFFAVLIVISAVGMGNSLWHKFSKHKTPVIAAGKSKPTVAAAVPRQEKAPVEFAIDLNIEPLATPNLDNYVQANLKLNALFAMAYQLKDYANQAAEVKFALTDKSTPLGQLKKAKKSRKYHRPAYVNYDYANQNNTNNPVVQ